MAIQEVPIRAQIYTGGVLLAETPYIQSFNVSRNRGSHSTFNASIKILGEDYDTISTDIVIWSGEKDNLIKIFTGHVKKASPSPCWDDPNYLYINIQGTDILAELDDKNITRRQTYSQNTWAKIDGVVRTGPKSGKFEFVKEPTIQVSAGKFDQATTNKIKTAPVDTKVTSPDNKDIVSHGNIRADIVNLIPGT